MQEYTEKWYTCDICGRSFKSSPKAPHRSSNVFATEEEAKAAAEACEKSHPVLTDAKIIAARYDPFGAHSGIPVELNVSMDNGEYKYILATSIK